MTLWRYVSKVTSLFRYFLFQFYDAAHVVLVCRFKLVSFYAALLPRRGPHIASHSVCLSVRPFIVRLSVRPVTVAIGYVFSAPLASRRATYSELQ